MSRYLEVIRSLYQAFAEGNVPSVLGALSPNVRWTEAAGGPYGGVYVGPQAVLERVFARIGAEWEGFTAKPAEFVCEGSSVVAIGEYSATFKATGKSFKAPFVHVWKFDGETIASFHQHTDTVLHTQPMHR